MTKQFKTQTGRVIEIETRAGMFAAVGFFAATESELRATLARTFGPEATTRELQNTAKVLRVA